MTVLWVKPQTNYTKDIGEKGRQSFRTSYAVWSDSATETRANILAAVPAYGSVHVENTSAICTKVTIERNRDNPQLSEVFAEWNTNTSDKDPREDQKQPDLRRQKWKFKFTPLPQDFRNDLDGKPFIDTAGTPFDPPPQVPLYVDEVTIELYRATCDRTIDRGYMNFTNNDIWVGAEPRTALIADIDADEVFEYGAYWFHYRYRILINPRYTVAAYGKDIDDVPITIVGGWNPSYALNAGPRELVGTEARPVERNGLVDGKLYMLDKFGTAMNPSALGTYGVNNSSLVYLKFRLVGECAFAPLNLTPPWSP